MEHVVILCDVKEHGMVHAETGRGWKAHAMARFSE